MTPVSPSTHQPERRAICLATAWRSGIFPVKGNQEFPSPVPVAARVASSTPAWGGVTAREGIYLLRRLAGLQLVAFDVNTVSPPHDVAGMTAMLAARVMLECLFLACRGPGA